MRTAKTTERVRWTLAALALLAGGCGLIASDEVDTGSIWAHFVVDHHPDDTATAWAELRRGGPIGFVLDLTGGDRVECNGVTLREYYEPVTDYHWLRSDVPVAADGRYRFELVRPADSASATLTMGERPTITGTEPEGSMDYTDPLTVRWDATHPGDGVDLRAEGDCISDVLADNQDDDGEYTFDRFSSLGHDDCTITVRVIRARTGIIYREFEAGLTEANREDAIALVFRPL